MQLDPIEHIVMQRPRLKRRTLLQIVDAKIRAGDTQQPEFRTSCGALAAVLVAPQGSWTVV